MARHIRAFRRARRILFFFALVAFPLTTSVAASADWEQLPVPPARLADGVYVFEDIDELSMWSLGSTVVEFAEPFIVSDNDRRVFIAYSDTPETSRYEKLIYFDVESNDYESATPISPTLDFMTFHPWAVKGNGLYVDDKVFVAGDVIGRIAEFNIATNTWTWSGIASTNMLPFPSVSTATDHELMYWYNGWRKIGVNDPEIGMPLINARQVRYLNDEYSTQVGVGVQDNEIYFFGGYYEYYTKGSYKQGTSSVNSSVYNFITRQELPMADLPIPQYVIGTVWGSDRLHSVGSSLFMTSFPWLSTFFRIARWSRHFGYDPVNDMWTDYDDLPLDCLPFSACGLDGWLYALFICPDDPSQLRLFRTYIGNWGTSTTTTTFTTTTTIPWADDDTSVDDLQDEPPSDDDALNDDDVEADADDDDDSGCGS